MSKKTKLNLLDFLIIICIIGGLTIGGMKIVKQHQSTNVNLKDIEYTLLLSEKNEELLRALKEGEVVTINHEQKDTAKIKSIKAVPAKILTFDSHNIAYRYDETDLKYDIYITFEAKASDSDTDIKVGSTSVKIGKSLSVRGSNYSAKGFVVELND